eukprot:TRINITY_DN4311_c0_g2_i2.p1 TRINITY_DN4311_c0_g2~~TRINITY_DN4311_c0_g2_i2.p1  ORF type:complete len:139 (+),score=14.67 TRINITY_DN4311_c0_g2_i2:279-695(+)
MDKDPSLGEHHLSCKRFPCVVDVHLPCVVDVHLPCVVDVHLPCVVDVHLPCVVDVHLPCGGCPFPHVPSRCGFLFPFFPFSLFFKKEIPFLTMLGRSSRYRGDIDTDDLHEMTRNRLFSKKRNQEYIIRFLRYWYMFF